MERTTVSGGLGVQDFLSNLLESKLLSTEQIERAVAALPSETPNVDSLGRILLAAGHLTAYQLEAVHNRRFAELQIGSYEILDRLGAGGMGTVFKAQHRRMKRIVALKVLPQNLAQDTQFVRRFQREVETIARLSLLGQLLELLLQALFVTEEDDEAAHLARAVLDRGSVDLLDQTGQGVADLAGEDHRDRVGTIGSDQALFRARKFARHIKRVKRARHRIPDLGTRFQGIAGPDAACPKRQGQGRHHGHAMIHDRETSSKKKTTGSPTGETSQFYIEAEVEANPADRARQGES